MRELNLIVFGNMHGASNVEGKAFIGGDLTNGTQFGVGRASQGATPSSRATLTVVGNTGGNSIQLQNGPNGSSGTVGTPPGVTVGGNLGGGLNMNAGGATVLVGGSIANTNGSNGSTITAGGGKVGNLNANGATVQLNQGAAFSAPLLAGLTAEQAKLEADLKALSGKLAGLETTAGNSTSVFGSRLTFNAVNSGNGTSVFNLTDAIFAFGEFDMQLADPTLTVIVNIFGDGSYDWNANAIQGLNASLNDNIIWNFSDATTLNVNRMTHGSILAPYARLANRADMEGSIVAASFQQSGQVHLGTFNGNIGFEEPVPEPASWAMMIAGFGLVGAMMRRRRSALAA
jgi:choice-of-anchor A domain-containing protein